MDTWDTLPTDPGEMEMRSEMAKGGSEPSKELWSREAWDEVLKIYEERMRPPPPGTPKDPGPLVIQEGDDFGRARDALKAGLPVVVMPANAPSPTLVPAEADVFDCVAEMY